MLEVALGQTHSEIIEGLLIRNPSLCPHELTASYEAGARAKVLSTLRLFPVINRVVPSANDKHEQIRRLLYEQKTATTYKKWYDVSAQLDELTGNNAWKLDPASPSYDYDLVYQNLTEMRRARHAKDYKLLLYLIRTKWSRNVGNMGDASLFKLSHVGTKRLIEEYIEECQLSLRYLVHGDDVNLDDRYLLGMLVQTRKNIGRTALLLSGGSTFGISHIGVLIALLENNLLPRIISGSSAGSIIASILCCQTNEEILELLATITDRDFTIFGLPGKSEGKLKSLLERASHFLKYGTLFDISGVRETIYGFVGDLTFREAYNRTGKILNITVSPASMHEQTRLLNYLTAPHCLIWSAVCASCSLPGIFPPNSIYEKNPRTNVVREWNYDQSLKYVDGSVDGDLPITRLSEMFNVDHIIAVQVNPHVSPVLNVSVGSIGGKADSELANTLRQVANDCYDFVQSEIIHYLQVLHELNIYKNLTSKMISLLTQKYSGDITILPELDVPDYLSLFSNPTPEFLLNFIIKGARASWPKITIINNHCGVEFALDKEISYLRGRLILNANNRLTYRNTNSSKGTHMERLADSNSYLISNPILSRINANPETPTKLNRATPLMRRHNSIGNGDLLLDAKAKAMRKKRATISAPINGEILLKGKSMTSLQSLNFKENNSSADTSPPGLADHSFDGTTMSSQPKKLSKTRSAASFNLDKTRNESTSIYDFRTSPKYEKTIHDAFDYQNYASKLLLNENKLEAQRTLGGKEQANLPKLSKPNSLKNSFIGLNKLKESLSRSNNGSVNNSKRNSSQNLRGIYNEHEQTMKSLNSKDLRRAFSKFRSEKRKVSFPNLKRKGAEIERTENTSEEGPGDQDSDTSTQDGGEAKPKASKNEESSTEKDEESSTEKDEPGSTEQNEPKMLIRTDIQLAAYYPYD